MSTITPEMPELKILDEPGRYRNLEPVGAGGQSYVYKAKDTNVANRVVAIKTPRDRPTEEDLRLFRREVDILAHLYDDNIVSIFNIGECEQDRVRKPYLV